MPDTIPTGFGTQFDEANYMSNVILAIRECAANAENFKLDLDTCPSCLKKTGHPKSDLKIDWTCKTCGDYRPRRAHVAFLHDKESGQDYLAFMHNGLPFASLQEIIEKACRPYSTGDQGNSQHGCGLTYASSILHPNHKVIVASKINGKILAGEGLANREDGKRLWETRDLTSECLPWMMDVIGPKTVSMFNVFYFFLVNPLAAASGSRRADKIENRTFLDGRTMVDIIPLMPPSVADSLDIRFTEREIGYPRYGDINPKRFMSLDSAFESRTSEGQGSGVTGVGWGGSIDSQVFSHLTYEDKYLEKKFKFEVNEPFYVAVNKPGCDGKRIRVTKAEVEVQLYKGDADAANTWMLTKRDGRDRNPLRRTHGYEAGNATYPGDRPRHNAFLLASFLSRNNDSTKRFNDNPIWFSGPVREYMSAMGLNYVEPTNRRGDPFAMVFVRVLDVEEKLYTMTPSGEEAFDFSKAQISDLTMEIKPDFTFHAGSACRALVKSTCIAARPSVTDDARAACKELFPEEQFDVMPITFGTDKPHPNIRYKVIDLEKGHDTGRLKFKLEEKRAIAVVDVSRTQKKFVGSEAIQNPSPGCDISFAKTMAAITRDMGSKRARNVEANMAFLAGQYRDKPKAFIVYVESCKDSDGNDIDSDEWEKGDSPAKRVCVRVHGNCLQLGEIVDLPESDERAQKPRRGNGSGTDDVVVYHPYKDRHPQAFCKWNEERRLLELNPKNEYIAKLFTNVRVANPRAIQLANELYAELNGIARTTFSAIGQINVSANKVCVNDDGVIVYDDNEYDFLVNQVVAYFLESSPSGRKLYQEALKAQGKDDDQEAMSVGHAESASRTWRNVRDPKERQQIVDDWKRGMSFPKIDLKHKLRGPNGLDSFHIVKAWGEQYPDEYKRIKASKKGNTP